jgi:hypothetical protein
MVFTNKNIAMSVVSGFLFVGLVGNVLISNALHPQVKSLDLSAFVNLGSNIEYLSEKKSKINDVERLKIEQFAIAGIERKIDAEIAKNKIVSVTRRAVAITKPIKEFQLSDEVKLAFSGLEKINSKVEMKVERIASNSIETIPSLKNEIIESKFKAEKINTIDMSLLNNLKESYDQATITINERNSTDDDLVVFDYPVEEESKTEKNFDKKLYDRPISSAVRNVIKREIISNPVKITPKFKTQENKEESVEIVEAAISRIDAKNENADYSNEEKELAKKLIDTTDEEQIVYDYSNINQLKNEATVANNFMSQEKSTQVSIGLKTIEIDNQNKKMINGFGFEFEPDYDRNERLYDNNSGIIQIAFNSAQSMNETAGIVYKQGFIPTRIDIVNENDVLKIPIFNEEGFEERYKIDSNNRNTILISKADGIEDIEIDSEYSAKLLLDSKFNIVKSNPIFVMFTSVKTGNIMVKYNHRGKTAQKIIFVGEGELYFQIPRFLEGERETFELTTKNLLATNEKNLEVNNGDLKVFNTNILSKKRALNVYELMMPKQVIGNRKYLELKNQENDVFIGVDSSGKIQVPNKEYIGKILEAFKTTDMNDRCLVQFNLKSPVVNFKIAGKNRTGEMFTEVLVLDQEGNLVSDDYSTAEKIFVLGEQEGQMSIHAETENGTIINAKSFCSNGTYLIEQL